MVAVPDSHEELADAWLLAWNPVRSSWAEPEDDFETRMEQVKQGLSTRQRWSVGGTKAVQAGDAVYLVRVGQEPRGVIGTGVVTRGSYQDLHWDPVRAAGGETAWFVEFRFVRLVDGKEEVLVPLNILLTECPTTSWTPRRSGIRVRAADLPRLDALIRMTAPATSSELQRDKPERFPEGMKKNISMNAYERNPHARQACIEHHGRRCKACGVLLEDRYGEAAKDLIHVHHLTPLSGHNGERQVDPVKDLVPVCPNCHAVMHRRESPYTVADLKTFLGRQRG